MNKIALFTISPTSLTGLLIGAVTRCPFSHAAIQIESTWYHASETTGEFSEVDIEQFRGRHCTVYQFDGELSHWLQEMKGKQYDWKGIRGWVKRLLGFKYTADDRKFYCFEAAVSAILQARLLHILDCDYMGTPMGDTDKKILKKIKNSDFDYDQFLIGTRGYVRHCQWNQGLTKKVISAVTSKPVTGCDLANLFPVGRTGTFLVSLGQ